MEITNIVERSRKARAKKIWYKGTLCYGYHEYAKLLRENYPEAGFTDENVKNFVNPKRGMSIKLGRLYPELVPAFIDQGESVALYIDTFDVIVMDTNRVKANHGKRY